MSTIQTLLEMGYSQELAEEAVKATSDSGVEPAVMWLLEHQEKMERAAAGGGGGGGSVGAVNNEPSGGDTVGSSDAASEPESTVKNENLVAKSMKCLDCGKILGDTSAMELHAARTKHANFEESTEEKKPLTEEEKRAQLALIQERMKQKRIEREERERQEAQEAERNRIRSGKDITEARKRLEQLEVEKMVAQRKMEKAEEVRARERVRAQIEADKVARKLREMENAATGASAGVGAASPTSPQAAAATTAIASAAATTTSATLPTSNKSYEKTRIVIRLLDGTTISETFGVKEELASVRLFIQTKTGNHTPFKLLTTFPRKVFDEEDWEKTLESLGLVPSAVVTMSKA